MPDDDDALAQWEAISARLAWSREPDAVYVEAPPRGRWFPGGELNVATNCLHRHVTERADAVAFHWEGEPGDRRALTYSELDADVRRLAVALRSLGVGPGDRVAMYVGLLPETVVAILACARIGAVHVIMPAVLPPDALEERIASISARVIITQDGAWRHGVVIPLKARADEAIAAVPSVQHTIVIRRTGMDVPWYEGDRWFHELVELAALERGDAEAFPSEHPLCVAHLASRRAQPIGILHGSANLLAYVSAIHADGFEASSEVFWFPSEIGWLGSQTHAIYGPLVCGATAVLFEGMLDTPSHERTWQIVERYRVSVLAATPSIIRNLRTWSSSEAIDQALKWIKRLVTAGEVIEPSLREWLEREVCPHDAEILDAWGQTELGGIVAFNERTDTAPRVPSAGLDVVDEKGDSVPANQVGELVLRNPWPGTFIAIEGSDAAAGRWLTRYPDCYATGDRARRRDDGTLEFQGRIDPVVSVSGQLVSLAEVRDVLLEHPYVASVVVGERSDPHTSKAVIALVEPGRDDLDREHLARELRSYVHETLGGLAQPRTIVFADGLHANLSDDAARGALRALCAAHPSATMLASSVAELKALAGGAPNP
jgi:acetyl-CoA synthetase